MNEQKIYALFSVLREVADESQAHPQVIEMLASLSRRIVALEKQIARLEQVNNSLRRDIETWAQEVERLKSRVKPESTAKGAPTRESVEKSLKEVLDLIYGSAEEE